MKEGGAHVSLESPSSLASTADITTVETQPKVITPQHDFKEESATWESDNKKDHEKSESDSNQSSVIETQQDNSKGDLQDQTNLLPMKQLFIVFAGLSSAMFCAMLNQTMFLNRLSCELDANKLTYIQCRNRSSGSGCCIS